MISDIKIQKVSKSHVIVDGIIYTKDVAPKVYNLVHSIYSLYTKLKEEIK